MEFSTLPAVLKRFAELNVWQRGDERAPHKPLLALLALGLFTRGIRDVPFRQYESKLCELLREFAPQRRTLYPEMPFVRLRNDDVWEVSVNHTFESVTSLTSLKKTRLRELDATGRFTDDVQRLFERDPNAIGEVARLLLSAHFPESFHDDILDAVGLSLDDLNRPAVLRRDPAFREGVLKAYQFRCALCNFDLRINDKSIGLEAAHIKWWQARGPSVIENGIALCCMHHKLFDRGAFTLGAQRRVLVSDEAYGSAQQFDEILLRHHGRQLNAPIHAEHHPSTHFVDWHRAQVFKGRARPI